METSNIPVGNFCWTDLGTTDAEAAKRFYTAIFGWTYNDMPMGEGQGVYSMCELNGMQVGALSEHTAGQPPRWTTYVAVENADASAAKVKELGGNVLMEPFDVFDAGRMAVVQDPTGAALCAWQPVTHRGYQLAGEPGSVVWNELNTRDMAKATEFYSAWLGWSAKAHEGPMAYTEFQNGGQSVAGMMAIQPQWGDVPPHWLVYFGTEDVDATLAKVTANGGKTLAGPMDIPSGGRFAVLMDPQGAVFAVYK
jgi:uncharacterized protein